MFPQHEYLLYPRTPIDTHSTQSSPQTSPAFLSDSTSSYPLSACSTTDTSLFTFPTIQENYSSLGDISQNTHQKDSESNIEADLFAEEDKDRFLVFPTCQFIKHRCVSPNRKFSKMTREPSLGDENKLILQANSTNKGIKESLNVSSYHLTEFTDDTIPESEDCAFAAKSANPTSPSKLLRDAFFSSSRRRSSNRLFSSAGSGIRSRLSSINRSLENSSMEDSSLCSSSSTHDSELLAAKSNYRIMILGTKRSGKTSIIQQFLYDKFSTNYKETIDDMYRGEFEIHGHTIGFDIQDVSGGYVYEYPGMRNVSFASADAFIIVYSLDSYDSWQEVATLRDMIHSEKSVKVPIVVVGNKSDLKGSFDPKIPHESTEATVVFDWENGYVESSAKDKFNIKKIFKELLQQSKTKYYFDTTSMASNSSRQGINLSNSPYGTPTSGGTLPAGFDFIRTNSTNTRIQCPKENDDCLKRRQSLPAVCPAHTIPKPTFSERDTVPYNSSLGKNNVQQGAKKTITHGKPQLASHNKNDTDTEIHHIKTSAGVEIATSETRRFSLAAPRKDSCKIS